MYLHSQVTIRNMTEQEKIHYGYPVIIDDIHALLDEARDEAFHEGHSDGYDEGKRDGEDEAEYDAQERIDELKGDIQDVLYKY